MTTISSAQLNEGWQSEKHYSQKVYHYIVDTFSLCRNLGFYTGDLEPHTGKKAKNDCARCFRLAEKRLAKGSSKGAVDGDNVEA